MLYLTPTPLYHKQNKGPPIMAMIAALNSIQVTLNLFLVCFSVYFRLLFRYSYFMFLITITNIGNFLFFSRYGLHKKTRSPKKRTTGIPAMCLCFDLDRQSQSKLDHQLLIADRKVNVECQPSLQTSVYSMAVPQFRLHCRSIVRIILHSIHHDKSRPAIRISCEFLERVHSESIPGQADLRVYDISAIIPGDPERLDVLNAQALKDGVCRQRTHD